MEEEKTHHEGRHSEHHAEHHSEHHPRQSHEKKNTYFSVQNIFLGLAVLLGILLIINIITAFGLNSELSKNAEIAKENARPADIELALIKNSKCPDCFDASKVADYVKTLNVKVTGEKSLEFDSAEAKSIISKYKILKVPAIVITGEVNKVNAQGLDKANDALILSQVPAPYTNAVNGRIEGRVMIYSLKDFSCGKCYNLSVLVSQISRSGVKIYDQKAFDSMSEEGKSLIQKYNIEFMPSIILSRDADAYPFMKQAWAQLGTKENDGMYVLRTPFPPFMNLTTGKINGLVNLVYLTDKSCTECYDVKLHRQILTSPQSFGMQLDSEETVDISDAKGKELTAKYNISQVPTVILSEGAGAYPSSKALIQFFSVQKDGSYVFIRPSVLGTYKDLASNKVVKPQAQAQQGTV